MPGQPEAFTLAGLPRAAEALLEAVMAISSNLEMHHVLDRIVVSSCELTGARYGALGVIGGDGVLSDFVTHGLDDETRARIGDLPRGRGILRGSSSSTRRRCGCPTSRTTRRRTASPPNHPPMTSFLGVPVRIRGTVFGNLYLTEKAGGGEFTEQDEVLVQALASTAGFVIENARAYALSERQRAWLEAAALLKDALEPPVAVDDALYQVALGARAVARATAVGVLRFDADGGISVLVQDGREADRVPDLVARLDADIRQAAVGDQPDPVELDRFRTAVVLRLHAQFLPDVVLLVVLDSSDALASPATKELEWLTAFADQAALALDRVQALADRQELAIVSDRDRIARDLHDVVIQRLFATGLSLQGVRATASNPAVAERIDRAVADLDTTIRDIRTTIFELNQRAAGTVRQGVHDLAREYTPVLGFGPTVRTHGPVETLVDDELSASSCWWCCARRSPTWPGMRRRRR